MKEVTGARDRLVFSHFSYTTNDTTLSLTKLNVKRLLFGTEERMGIHYLIRFKTP